VKNLGALSKQQKTLMTAVVLMVIAVAVAVVGLLPRFVDQTNDKKILEAGNVLALEQARNLTAILSNCKQLWRHK
jgi:putative exporter of polyketide antibiotics